MLLFREIGTMSPRNGVVPIMVLDAFPGIAPLQTPGVDSIFCLCLPKSICFFVQALLAVVPPETRSHCLEFGDSLYPFHVATRGGCNRTVRSCCAPPSRQ